MKALPLKHTLAGALASIAMFLMAGPAAAQSTPGLRFTSSRIELKYIKRSEDSPMQRERVITEAETQLRQYWQDARVREVLGPATLHPLVLVYSGWELVYRAEWAADRVLA